MDIIIVSSGSLRQATYWEERLLARRGQLIPPHSLILCVHEDWPEGAGNGLGTLYAYRKACEKARQEFGIDIIEQQQNGASVGLYHTAGSGKRLAPLTLSEHNNKSAVNLPSASIPLLSILEVVIKQTLGYAAALKGRLSVFWGDQLFFPSPAMPPFNPDRHIAVFAMKHSLLTAREWKEKKMDQYGMITLGGDDAGQHIEKCDYETLQKLILTGKVQAEKGIATSLGSFSLSSEMTLALMEEFKPELEKRRVKMDCETSIWMPLTLPPDVFGERMQKGGISLAESTAHYERMKRFKKKFPSALFGIIDCGTEGYWWDYGTLEHYFENNLKLTKMNDEGRTMRRFLELPTKRTDFPGVSVDSRSQIVDCNIRSGYIKNSVLIGVTADHLDISDCILIRSTLHSFTGSRSLLYHVTERMPFSVLPDFVRADLSRPGQEPIKIISSLTRDGKADWAICLPGNSYSYDRLYSINSLA